MDPLGMIMLSTQDFVDFSFPACGIRFRGIALSISRTVYLKEDASHSIFFLDPNP